MKSFIQSSRSLTFNSRNYPLVRVDSSAAADFALSPEALAYRARVIADGGVVSNFSDISASIKTAKTDGWYNNAVCWFIGSGGYRSVGSKIDKWYNIPGNINGADGIQTTDAFRPSYLASAINGRPGIFFDSAAGEGRILNLGNIGAFFPTAASIFIAYTVFNQDVYALFHTNDNDQYWRYVGGVTYNGAFRNGRISNVTPNVPITNNGTAIYSVTSDSSAHNIYINGVQATNQAADYSPGNVHTIGDSQIVPGRTLKGYMAEVIVLNVVPSTTLRTTIENRLKSRYGIV